jgi:hypothetical protein
MTLKKNNFQQVFIEDSHYVAEIDVGTAGIER